ACEAGARARWRQGPRNRDEQNEGCWRQQLLLHLRIRLRTSQWQARRNGDHQVHRWREGDRHRGRQGRVGLMIKRSIDLAIAVASLILLSPLFLVIALAIKRDSPGPVFDRGK